MPLFGGKKDGSQTEAGTGASTSGDGSLRFQTGNVSLSLMGVPPGTVDKILDADTKHTGVETLRAEADKTRAEADKTRAAANQSWAQSVYTVPIAAVLIAFMASVVMHKKVTLPIKLSAELNHSHAAAEAKKGAMLLLPFAGVKKAEEMK